MCNKNFIFVNNLTKQLFRSSAKDVVEGFICFRDYRLASGDVNAQSFDNDRSDLIDDGWVEIPSPQYIHVALVYLKDSGKYYAEGSVKVLASEAHANPSKSYFKLMEHVRTLVDSGDLPGLVKGSKFDTYMGGSEHPGGYPHLFRIN